MRIVPALLFACVAAVAQAPRTWADKDLAEWALPILGINQRPGHFPEADYYRAPVDNLRTYPVYHPDREPPGYWESLKKKAPLPLIEPEKLKTPGDWIQAGRRVFEELDATVIRTSNPKIIEMARSREALAQLGVKPQPDGTLFGYRWVVTSEGTRLSFSECVGCHARHMSDGTVLHGAPFNAPGDGLGAQLIFDFFKSYFQDDPLPMTFYRQFGVPWMKGDIHESLKTMPEPEIEHLLLSHIPGVFARFNGSPFFLTKVPDLIGMRERKYIDHTATHRHRGPGDLMRYAALITGADSADFGPHRMLTDKQRRLYFHYSDELLYALAEYIYSLEPPANPYKSDARAAGGKTIFEREGCGTCHTPPLYTNNKLTPATGFRPPKEHFKMFDILDVSVGTDPDLALKTRKATGYYKVPSLKGVWYRGLYLHDGAVASLEDLFDSRRLHNTYVPSGFRGYKVANRAVPGHEFGLKLRPEEKADLIAFLRTL